MKAICIAFYLYKFNFILTDTLATHMGRVCEILSQKERIFAINATHHQFARLLRKAYREGSSVILGDWAYAYMQNWEERELISWKLRCSLFLLC